MAKDTCLKCEVFIPFEDQHSDGICYACADEHVSIREPGLQECQRRRELWDGEGDFEYPYCPTCEDDLWTSDSGTSSRI